MCGICGAVRLDGSSLSDRVKRMVAILRHRGPDGWGVQEPAPGVALGHARLAVVDKAGGAQPITRGGITSVINGQLYDYGPLRRELEATGTRFDSRCDSELVPHLYDRHGLAFLERLRGEFALALYDRDRRRLLLARDRLGVRPLYYSLDDKGLCFGSEVKALFAFGIPREMSAKGIVSQLMHVPSPGNTPFDGVKELKPGHILIVQQSGNRLDAVERPWWTLPGPSNPGVPPMDMDTAMKNLRAALRHAVQSRLTADVPVACYLSGGIDSAIVSALASDAKGLPVPTLTIGFDDPRHDESDFAVATAAAIGAPNHICRLSADDLLGQPYEDTVWHTEKVMYGMLGVARRQMAAFARAQGFTVVLTGDGADELFGGYVQFERDMALAAVDSANRISALHRRYGLSAPPIEEGYTHPALDRHWGGTPSWLQTWLWSLDELRPLLSDRLLNDLHHYDPVEDLMQALDGDALRKMHPLDRAQSTWIQTALPHYILGWSADRVEMAHGVESRPRFLDLDVVTLARHLPPEWRIHGQTVKWLLRQSMADVIPEPVRMRAKRGFLSPPGPASAHWNDFLQKWLSWDRVAAAGLFDPHRLHSFLSRRHDGYKARQVEKLTHIVLCLHILHERFCVADIPTLSASLANRMEEHG